MPAMRAASDEPARAGSLREAGEIAAIERGAAGEILHVAERPLAARYFDAFGAGFG